MSSPLHGAGYLRPPKRSGTKEDLITAVSVLDYNPLTGLFTWKVRRGSAVAGGVAGYLNQKGYVVIMLGGKCIYAHRLAWELTFNESPREVDHINGDRSDNRICNLRNSSRSENSLNTGISERNKSGIKGVCFNKKYKTWQAYGSKNGKQVNLGQFKDINDAISARSEFVNNNYSPKFYRES